MTPADHIAEAERLVVLVQSDYDGVPVGNPGEDALLAVAHALIALAVENGVPHTTAPTGEQPSGT